MGYQGIGGISGTLVIINSRNTKDTKNIRDTNYIRNTKDTRDTKDILDADDIMVNLRYQCY